MNFLMNIAMSVSRLLAAQTTDKLHTISEQVNNILKGWIGPLMIALGGVGTVYIIVMAIQFIKSENDAKRAEAKSRMVNCLIGVIAILVIGAVCTVVQWDQVVVELFGQTSY